MANLKTGLMAAVEKDGEIIEAIVIGPHDNSRRVGEKDPKAGVLLSVEEALALLDEDYSDGYGGADCRPFYAWTATKVWFVGEYDGATWLAWTPRHPVENAPSFSGEQA